MHFLKTFSVAPTKVVQPSATELHAIRQHATDPSSITEENIFCGLFALCNDQYDRAFERFPEDYLKQFARTTPGKAVLVGHDYSTEPVGRFYDAEVQTRDGRKDLVTAYYMLKSDPLVAKINAGICKDVSVGYDPDKRLCDLCGKDYDGWFDFWFDDEDEDEDDICNHIAGREYNGKVCTLTYGGDVNKVELVEGSLVWRGCQPNAEAIAANGKVSTSQKAARLVERMEKKRLLVPAGTTLRKEDRMTDEEKAAAAAKAAADKAAADKGGADKPPDPAKALRLQTAGQKYIDSMLAQIQNRWTVCGAEQTGKAICAALVDAPVEAIEMAREEVEKQFNAKFPPPTHGTADSDGVDSSGDRAAREGESVGFNPLAFGGTHQWRL